MKQCFLALICLEDLLLAICVATYIGTCSLSFKLETKHSTAVLQLVSLESWCRCFTLPRTLLSTSGVLPTMLSTFDFGVEMPRLALFAALLGSVA